MNKLRIRIFYRIEDGTCKKRPLYWYEYLIGDLCYGLPYVEIIYL